MCAAGETLLTHRPAVVDRDRVERQVHLGGQVERHPLGTLGLDDASVLLEDRALELLQYLGRLVGVVVAPDHDVAGAPVLGDRL